MEQTLRCVKAEYYKHKHSAFLYIHIVVPVLYALVFAGYFRMAAWNDLEEAGFCLGAIAIAFPFIIGIVTGMTAQTERQAGHFQVLLGVIPSRTAAYIGKLVFLMFFACVAIAISFGLFAVLNRNMPPALYLKSCLHLLIMNLPVYMIHLLVAFHFGMGASMGFGIAGTLISALMQTGLGDHVWLFIPWAWGVRVVDYLVIEAYQPQLILHYESAFHSGTVVALCTAMLLLVFSIVRICYWDGGRVDDL